MKSLYILLVLSLSFMPAISKDNENQKGEKTITLSNPDLVESVII